LKKNEIFSSNDFPFQIIFNCQKCHVLDKNSLALAGKEKGMILKYE